MQEQPMLTLIQSSRKKIKDFIFGRKNSQKFDVRLTKIHFCSHQKIVENKVAFVQSQGSFS